ncbi:DUF6455 family protein [Pseudooceanicola nanhaiensis]|uniref:DUF6455 family protein n=1 Tax=Pseudooceanicola nanhaiensis TaxID=375761 RepID=UPI001CD38C6D|nr:DUF6455 family protein [Pseudooceanicola nanhaiensis]MCA0922346.1 DUF6455 family protein [Pseudooceanicola nanhaiensis]
MLTKFFERLDARAALVSQMADRVGVDFAENINRAPEVVGDYRAAVMRCTGCTEADRCATIDASVHEVPGYCRNKLLLDRLAVA